MATDTRGSSAPSQRSHRRKPGTRCRSGRCSVSYQSWNSSSATCAIRMAAISVPLAIGVSSLGSYPLLHQPLVGHPALDELGNLVRVLVHHHHVAVALDPELGQLPPVGHATVGAQGLGVALGGGLKALPHFTLVDEVSPHHQVGHVLSFPAISSGLGVPVGSMEMSALTLSGAAREALKPKLPPWLWVMITQGQTFCTSWL